MYNFDVNSTKRKNNFFIFFSLLCTRQHSIIEHDFSSRAKPSSPFYPFLLERIRRVGGGEEGKVEIRRIGRARVKSSRRFELFRGGVSNDTGGRKFAPKEARRTTKKWKKRRGAETRSGEDARVPRVCQLEMFARDQPIPPTSTSRPRFLREKFQSCSNATPRE